MRARLLAVAVPLRPWFDGRSFARTALLVADCLAQPTVAKKLGELAKVGRATRAASRTSASRRGPCCTCSPRSATTRGALRACPVRTTATRANCARRSEEPAVAPAPSSRPSARAHGRRAAELEVDFASDSNFYVGFAENLSGGGLVATYVLRPIGTVLDLSIRLAGDAEPLHVRGEVRWTREPSRSGDLWPGMGVRFFGSRARGRGTRWCSTTRRARRPAERAVASVAPRAPT
jgi:uncharacterized protein (TIGR02266 family)